MELIVAGATSYIGKRFISFYHNKYRILALGRNENKLRKLFSKLEVEYMTYDSFFRNNGIVKDDKILINFAFPRNPDIDNIIQVFDFTSMLYSISVNFGVNKIINISSQSVYDYKRVIPATEDDLPKPFSLYGIAKYYSESYLCEFSMKNNIEYLNIRLGSVIGPEFNQRFINKLIINFMNGNPIEIIDNGYKHSFIFIDDIVQNLNQVILSDIKWNDNYNIGSDNYYTISEVMNMIMKIVSNGKPDIISKKESIDKIPFTNRISNDKIKKFLDNYYDISLEGAISKLCLHQSKLYLC